MFLSKCFFFKVSPRKQVFNPNIRGVMVRSATKTGKRIVAEDEKKALQEKEKLDKRKNSSQDRDYKLDDSENEKVFTTKSKLKVGQMTNLTPDGMIIIIRQD